MRRRRIGTRAGLTVAQENELKRLHRWCVMLRYGKAAVAYEDRRETWFGPCPMCGRPNYLQCCHFKPVGKFPRMRFDPDNAFACCALCHIYTLHRDVDAANEFFTKQLGAHTIESLRLRAQTGQPPLNYQLVRIALRQELQARGVLSDFDRSHTK